MKTRRGPSGSSLVAVSFAVVLAACGGGGRSNEDDTPVSRTMTLGEVQTFDVAAMEGCEPDMEDSDKIICAHVDQEVRYDPTPPVGGMHSAVFQDCRFYEEPIFSEGGVHSLERGAVWITFDPELSDDQVDRIRTLAEGSKVLASPWDLGELPVPIVLSAWGAQLPLDELPDEAAEEFVAERAGAGSAPQPDASCSGGYDGTRSDP